MEIGKQLKAARERCGYTQEQVAEAISVSRQTVSNWENEHSYPDICSIVKLSDLYAISLDTLLKGDPAMIQHLKTSTDVVQSKTRLRLLLPPLIFLLIWAIALLIFWCFTDGSDAMGYALLFFYLVLPVAILVTSFFLGLDTAFGHARWAMPLYYGALYLLAEYGTFELANILSNGHLSEWNMPSWGLLPVGAALSLLGIGAGVLVRFLKARTAKKGT